MPVNLSVKHAVKGDCQGLRAGEGSADLCPPAPTSCIPQPSARQAGMGQGWWWESATAWSLQDTTTDPRPCQKGTPLSKDRVKSRDSNQHLPDSHGKSWKSSCGPKSWYGLVRHRAKHACRVAAAEAAWSGTGSERASLSSAVALGEEGEATCFWLCTSRPPAALLLSWHEPRKPNPRCLLIFMVLSVLGYLSKLAALKQVCFSGFCGLVDLSYKHWGHLKRTCNFFRCSQEKTLLHKQCCSTCDLRM